VSSWKMKKSTMSSPLPGTHGRHKKVYRELAIS
jgi:hypothetical protein